MSTILFATQLIGSLLLGTITGVALSHLLQKGMKASLTSAQYLLVQQRLYLAYGPVMGMMELTASLLVLTTTLLLPSGTLPYRLSLVAYIGTVAVFLIWAILIRPINNQVATWTANTLPADWEMSRDRWARLHVVRLLIVLLTTLLFIASSMVSRSLQ